LNSAATAPNVANRTQQAANNNVWLYAIWSLGAFLTLLAIGMADGALFYPLTIVLALAILAPIFKISKDQEAAA
jgi:hypothetical protein